MAKVRKQRIKKYQGSASKKPLVVRQEAVYNALYNYADKIKNQMVEKNITDIDPDIVKVADIILDNFNRASNKIIHIYGKAFSDKVIDYLNNKIGDVIDSDLIEKSGPGKLRPDFMLLISIDYLLNRAKHKRSSNEFAWCRLTIESIIKKYKAEPSIQKQFGYNTVAFEHMLGDKSIPLEWNDKHSKLEHVKMTARYHASLMFSVLPLFYSSDEIKDKNTIAGYENASKNILAYNSALGDETRVDKTQLIKHIEENIRDAEEDGTILVSKMSVFYALLRHIRDYDRASDIHKVHFGEIGVDGHDNIDLRNEVVKNNVDFAYGQLMSFQVEFDESEPITVIDGERKPNE